MEYPVNDFIKEPVLYEINQETEEKKISNTKGVLREGEHTNTVRWPMEHITKGQTFRIEW
jgi:hypothetical protein